jgi:hypothetical protein
MGCMSKTGEYGQTKNIKNMYTNVFMGCNIGNPRVEGFTGVINNKTKKEKFTYSYCHRLFSGQRQWYKVHSDGCTVGISFRTTKRCTNHVPLKA